MRKNKKAATFWNLLLLVLALVLIASIPACGGGGGGGSDSSTDDTTTETTAPSSGTSVPSGTSDTSASGDMSSDTSSVSTLSNGKVLADVHGAGAQRSDPKSGDPDDYSDGHGPQGDVVYIYNYARCVRDDSSANTANKYPIADSGQNKCYDDGTSGEISCPAEGASYHGQDAQYSGNTPSYTDNGDQTVTDNVTGLMWQKGFQTMEWDSAASAAASATTGGYSDWRVPSIQEMYSLIQFSGATGSGDLTSSTAPDDAVPYLNTTYFDFEYPSENRYIDAQYITTATYVSQVMVDVAAGEFECFFGVNLADGRIKCYPKTVDLGTKTYYAKFVRGNTNYGTNDFQDNGNNTITDNATGLTWMKVDSGDSSVRSLSGYTNNDGSLKWQEALSFCEDMTFAGASDWRLPNAKEPHSILDYTRSPDTTNSAAISSLFSITSINDKAGNTDYPFFWTSTTHLDGQTLGEYGIYMAFGEAEGLLDDSSSSSGTDTTSAPASGDTTGIPTDAPSGAPTGPPPGS